MRRVGVAGGVGGPVAAAPGDPHYDVPRGFSRCPQATALHGFFKWASVRDSDCRRAATFMRAYATRAGGTPPMPRHVAVYTCRIHYWRDSDGNAYASRHVCRKRDVIVRFYGMV